MQYKIKLKFNFILHFKINGSILEIIRHIFKNSSIARV